MTANLQRELDHIQAKVVAEHRAQVARAVDTLAVARHTIETARATLEAAEALAIVLADEGDERFDEFSFDLGTDRLAATMLEISQLARV